MIKFSYDWAVGMRGTVVDTGPPPVPTISDIIPGG